MNAPAKINRRFLPPDFRIAAWEDLAPWLEKLKQSEHHSTEDLRQWLLDLSELEAHFFENMAWRYIRMTTDTANESYRDAFTFFVNEIEPKAAPYFDAFNRKLTGSPFAGELAQTPGYAVLIRNKQKAVSVFRKENVPLLAEMAMRSQEYGAMVGAMSIDFNGKTYTIPQAGLLLESQDRSVREAVFLLIAARRMEDRTPVNQLMSDLVQLRHRVAQNAGYDNYRDYKFDDLARFDYTPADCRLFHDSVASEVLPLISALNESRKEALGIDELKPFDTAVDFRGSGPLVPFGNAEELISKGQTVLSRVHPFFGECISEMKSLGHLDLESRAGKSPGGYNYPLYESGYPFIFMNAAGTQMDMVTLMHEAGHAVHSVLSQNLELTAFKSCPSEVAELASMSMELISMDHWDVFYPDPEDLRRARQSQLDRCIEGLPWIAAIDAFQHWLYENPSHSEEERMEHWRSIYTRFHGDLNWQGSELYRDHFWQKQLHLFEVPFYYIEYGMAQLGAIAVWRNYKRNPEKGLEQYINALKLGNTCTISEVYEAAGIRFDFSAAYIRELMEFVAGEMKAI